MARRAENYFRRMAGMPPRDNGKKRKQKADAGNGARRGGQNPRRHTDDGPIIPKEYAEDVEFTEYKEYSEADLLRTEEPDGTTTYRESQVEDAEYTEIKKS